MGSITFARLYRNFTANATGSFFPRTCCIGHKKHDKREPGLFKNIKIKLQLSELSLLQHEESGNDWFSMLNFWFDKFNLVELINDEFKSLERFIINCTASLFIVQIYIFFQFVSATTVELGFSSCLRALTADCTKLLRHFLGIYWTNWWFFFVQSRPRFK